MTRQQCSPADTVLSIELSSPHDLVTSASILLIIVWRSQQSWIFIVVRLGGSFFHCNRLAIFSVEAGDVLISYMSVPNYSFSDPWSFFDVLRRPVFLILIRDGSGKRCTMPPPSLIQK